MSFVIHNEPLSSISEFMLTGGLLGGQPYSFRIGLVARRPCYPMPNYSGGEGGEGLETEFNHQWPKI